MTAPPIFPPGFHRVSLADLAAKCVEPFPGSTSRARLFEQLEALVRRIETSGVHGDLWIDGSFLTQKRDPGDVDLVLIVEHERWTRFSAEQKGLFLYLNDPQQHTRDLDSYAILTYPHGHDAHVDGEWTVNYYKGHWGWDLNREPKGIAVMRFSD